MHITSRRVASRHVTLHTTPHHTTPHNITPRHATPHHTTPHQTTPHNITPYHTSHNFTLNQIIPQRITSKHTTPHQIRSDQNENTTPYQVTSHQTKCFNRYNHLKLNSGAWVCERTILTERPPLVNEFSANLCGYRVPRCQRDGSLRPYSRISRPDPLLFLPSTSSIVVTRLNWPRLDPLLLRKPDSSGNRTRTSWSVSDHRGGRYIHQIPKIIFWWILFWLRFRSSNVLPVIPSMH
jgi:hypothetical protein